MKEGVQEGSGRWWEGGRTGNAPGGGTSARMDDLAARPTSPFASPTAVLTPPRCCRS